MTGFGQMSELPKKEFLIDDSRICLSPYTWKLFGSGSSLRAEAMMPGAYFRVMFENSPSIDVLIDGEANRDCPADAMPVVDFSIDGRAFQTIQLKNKSGVAPFSLDKNLDPRKQHSVEFYFRASCLGPDRWGSTATHLRLAGIQLDAEGALLPCPIRPKLAIGLGDSITEGVCSEGACAYYSNLLMNNARVTWFPLVSNALNCEYGQLGSGGLGLLKPMSLPPLMESWDHFDPQTSRLTNGLLLPEPDYLFCCIGTNDFQDEGGKRTQMDITAAYINWLRSARTACPKTQIFCITPPIGWHTAEIAAAVHEHNKKGDAGIHLIDMTPLHYGFGENNIATQFAPDGCHPTVYGNAMLGAFIAAKAQKILSRCHE